MKNNIRDFYIYTKSNDCENTYEAMTNIILQHMSLNLFFRDMGIKTKWPWKLRSYTDGLL